MRTIAFVMTMVLVLQAKTWGADLTYFGDALKDKSITFSATADDKYAAKMKMKIKNRKKKKMVVGLEPGRIFYPESNGIQPFVVARPAIITLDPDEEKEVWVFARCGNSKAKAPRNEHTFNRTVMGDEEMIRSLSLMNKLQIESMDFYQRVIWFYTNGLHISAVHSRETAVTVESQIIRDICRRHALELPWYRKTYKPAESGNDMEFSGTADKIEANMDVVLSKGSDLQIHLVDQQGNTVRFLGVHNLKPPGVHAIPIEIDLSLLNETTYTIRITDENGAVIESKTFVV